tara:strand:+ start:2583 stop:16283 length:13701 start_codon:yes stop_codon:yes gene_type:complete
MDIYKDIEKSVNLRREIKDEIIHSIDLGLNNLQIVDNSIYPELVNFSMLKYDTENDDTDNITNISEFQENLQYFENIEKLADNININHLSQLFISIALLNKVPLNVENLYEDFLSEFKDKEINTNLDYVFGLFLYIFYDENDSKKRNTYYLDMDNFDTLIADKLRNKEIVLPLKMDGTASDLYTKQLLDIIKENYLKINFNNLVVNNFNKKNYPDIAKSIINNNYGMIQSLHMEGLIESELLDTSGGLFCNNNHADASIINCNVGNSDLFMDSIYTQKTIVNIMTNNSISPFVNKNHANSLMNNIEYFPEYSIVKNFGTFLPEIKYQKTVEYNQEIYTVYYYNTTLTKQDIYINKNLFSETTPVPSILISNVGENLTDIFFSIIRYLNTDKSIYPHLILIYFQEKTITFYTHNIKQNQDISGNYSKIGNWKENTWTENKNIQHIDFYIMRGVLDEIVILKIIYEDNSCKIKYFANYFTIDSLQSNNLPILGGYEWDTNVFAFKNKSVYYGNNAIEFTILSFDKLTHHTNNFTVTNTIKDISNVNKQIVYTGAYDTELKNIFLRNTNHTLKVDDFLNLNTGSFNIKNTFIDQNVFDLSQELQYEPDNNIIYTNDVSYCFFITRYPYTKDTSYPKTWKYKLMSFAESEIQDLNLIYKKDLNVIKNNNTNKTFFVFKILDNLYESDKSIVNELYRNPYNIMLLDNDISNSHLQTIRDRINSLKGEISQLTNNINQTKINVNASFNGYFNENFWKDIKKDLNIINIFEYDDIVNIIKLWNENQSKSYNDVETDISVNYVVEDWSVPENLVTTNNTISILDLTEYNYSTYFNDIQTRISDFEFKWKRGDTDISNATSNSYKVTVNDIGNKLSVEINDTAVRTEIINSAPIYNGKRKLIYNVVDGYLKDEKSRIFGKNYDEISLQSYNNIPLEFTKALQFSVQYIDKYNDPFLFKDFANYNSGNESYGYIYSSMNYGSGGADSQGTFDNPDNAKIEYINDLLNTINNYESTLEDKQTQLETEEKNYDVQFDIFVDNVSINPEYSNRNIEYIRQEFYDKTVQYYIINSDIYNYNFSFLFYRETTDVSDNAIINLFSIGADNISNISDNEPQYNFSINLIKQETNSNNGYKLFTNGMLLSNTSTMSFNNATPNASPIIDNERWYKIDIDISNNQLQYKLTYKYVKELIYYEKILKTYYRDYENIPDVSYNNYKIKEILINDNSNLHYYGKYNTDISKCSYIVINIDISGNGYDKYYVKIKDGNIIDYSNNINTIDYSTCTYNIFNDDIDISFNRLLFNDDHLKTKILFNSQPLTITSNLIYKDIYIVNNNSILGKNGITYIYDILNSNNNSFRPTFTINDDDFKNIIINNNNLSIGYDMDDISVFMDNDTISKRYFKKDNNKQSGASDKYYYKLQEYNLENVYIKQLNEYHCEIWYDNQKCYDFSKNTPLKFYPDSDDGPTDFIINNIDFTNSLKQVTCDSYIKNKDGAVAKIEEETIKNYLHQESTDLFWKNTTKNHVLYKLDIDEHNNFLDIGLKINTTLPTNKTYTFNFSKPSANINSTFSFESQNNFDISNLNIDQIFPTTLDFVHRLPIHLFITMDNGNDNYILITSNIPFDRKPINGKYTKMKYNDIRVIYSNSYFIIMYSNDIQQWIFKDINTNEIIIESTKFSSSITKYSRKDIWYYYERYDNIKRLNVNESLYFYTNPKEYTLLYQNNFNNNNKNLRLINYISGYISDYDYDITLNKAFGLYNYSSPSKTGIIKNSLEPFHINETSLNVNSFESFIVKYVNNDDQNISFENFTYGYDKYNPTLINLMNAIYKEYDNKYISKFENIFINKLDHSNNFVFVENFEYVVNISGDILFEFGDTISNNIEIKTPSIEKIIMSSSENKIIHNINYCTLIIDLSNSTLTETTYQDISNSFLQFKYGGDVSINIIIKDKLSAIGENRLYSKDTSDPNVIKYFIGDRKIGGINKPILYSSVKNVNNGEFFHGFSNINLQKGSINHLIFDLNLTNNHGVYLRDEFYTIYDDHSSSMLKIEYDDTKNKQWKNNSLQIIVNELSENIDLSYNIIDVSDNSIINNSNKILFRDVNSFIGDDLSGIQFEPKEQYILEPSNGIISIIDIIKNNEVGYFQLIDIYSGSAYTKLYLYNETENKLHFTHYDNDDKLKELSKNILNIRENLITNKYDIIYSEQSSNINHIKYKTDYLATNINNGYIILDIYIDAQDRIYFNTNSDLYDKYSDLDLTMVFIKTLAYKIMNHTGSTLTFKDPTFVNLDYTISSTDDSAGYYLPSWLYSIVDFTLQVQGVTELKGKMYDSVESILDVDGDYNKYKHMFSYFFNNNEHNTSQQDILLTTTDTSLNQTKMVIKNNMVVICNQYNSLKITNDPSLKQMDNFNIKEFNKDTQSVGKYISNKQTPPLFSHIDNVNRENENKRFVKYLETDINFGYWVVSDISNTNITNTDNPDSVFAKIKSTITLDPPISASEAWETGNHVIRYREGQFKYEYYIRFVESTFMSSNADYTDTLNYNDTEYVYIPSISNHFTGGYNSKFYKDVSLNFYKDVSLNSILFSVKLENSSNDSTINNFNYIIYRYDKIKTEVSYYDFITDGTRGILNNNIGAFSLLYFKPTINIKYNGLLDSYSSYIVEDIYYGENKIIFDDINDDDSIIEKNQPDDELYFTIEAINLLNTNIDQKIKTIDGTYIQKYRFNDRTLSQLESHNNIYFSARRLDTYKVDGIYKLVFENTENHDNHNYTSLTSELYYTYNNINYFFKDTSKNLLINNPDFLFLNYIEEEKTDITIHPITSEKSGFNITNICNVNDGTMSNINFYNSENEKFNKMYINKIINWSSTANIGLITPINNGTIEEINIGEVDKIENEYLYEDNVHQIKVINKQNTFKSGILVGENSGSITNVNVNNYNKLVDGLYIEGGNCGLFGLNNNGCTIDNITLNTKLKVKNSSNTGLLISENKGILDNITLYENDITFESNINNNNNGGLVGINTGTVINVFNKSNYKIVIDNTNNVANYIGGLFGFNYESAVIENIFFNNYDISINATNYVGGFVGYTETEDFNGIYYTQLTNNKNKIFINAVDNVGGFVGEMAQPKGNTRDFFYRINTVNINAVNNVGGIIGTNHCNFLDFDDVDILNLDINAKDNIAFFLGKNSYNNFKFNLLFVETKIFNFTGNNIRLEGENNIGYLIGYNEIPAINLTSSDDYLDNTILNLNLSGKLNIRGNNNLGGIIGKNDFYELRFIDVNGVNSKLEIDISVNQFNNIYNETLNIGGIIGYNKHDINAIKINNVNLTIINNTDISANCGGFIGYNFNNTNGHLNNITYNQYKIDISNNWYTGGLIGFNENSFNFNMNTVNYNNIEKITLKGTHVGGLIGKNKGEYTIQNITFNPTVQEITIHSEEYGGGFIGYNETIVNTLSNTNNVLTNFNLHTGKLNISTNKTAGGFIGYTNNASIDIFNYTNINGNTLLNIENRYIHDINNDNGVGGIIGVYDSIENLNNTIQIKNIECNAHSLLESNSNCGGVIGYVKNNNTNDSFIDIDTLKVYLPYESISYSENVGGVIGNVNQTNSATFYLKNINIENKNNDKESFKSLKQITNLSYIRQINYDDYIKVNTFELTYFIPKKSNNNENYLVNDNFYIIEYNSLTEKFNYIINRKKYSYAIFDTVYSNIIMSEIDNSNNQTHLYLFDFINYDIINIDTINNTLLDIPININMSKLYSDDNYLYVFDSYAFHYMTIPSIDNNSKISYQFYHTLDNNEIIIDIIYILNKILFIYDNKISASDQNFPFLNQFNENNTTDIINNSYTISTLKTYFSILPYIYLFIIDNTSNSKCIRISLDILTGATTDDVNFNYVNSKIHQKTIDYEIIDDISGGINNLKISLLTNDGILYPYDIINDNMYYNTKNINVNDNSINIINIDNITTIDIINENLISKRFIMSSSLQDILIDVNRNIEYILNKANKFNYKSTNKKLYTFSDIDIEYNGFIVDTLQTPITFEKNESFENNKEKKKGKYYSIKLYSSISKKINIDITIDGVYASQLTSLFYIVVNKKQLSDGTISFTRTEINNRLTTYEYSVIFDDIDIKPGFNYINIFVENKDFKETIYFKQFNISDGQSNDNAGDVGDDEIFIDDQEMSKQTGIKYIFYSNLKDNTLMYINNENIMNTSYKDSIVNKNKTIIYAKENSAGVVGKLQCKRLETNKINFHINNDVTNSDQLSDLIISSYKNIAYFISDVTFDAANIGSGTLNFINNTFKVNYSKLQHCLDNNSNINDLNIGGLIGQIKGKDNNGSYTVNVENTKFYSEFDIVTNYPTNISLIIGSINNVSNILFNKAINIYYKGNIQLFNNGIHNTFYQGLLCGKSVTNNITIENEIKFLCDIDNINVSTNVSYFIGNYEDYLNDKIYLNGIIDFTDRENDTTTYNSFKNYMNYIGNEVGISYGENIKNIKLTGKFNIDEPYSYYTIEDRNIIINDDEYGRIIELNSKFTKNQDNKTGDIIISYNDTYTNNICISEKESNKLNNYTLYDFNTQRIYNFKKTVKVDDRETIYSVVDDKPNGKYLRTIDEIMDNVFI